MEKANLFEEDQDFMKATIHKILEEGSYLTEEAKIKSFCLLLWHDTEKAFHILLDYMAICSYRFLKSLFSFSI